MEKRKKHLDDLHFEHQLWLSEAKFYADELKIYQKRLEEVSAKNSSSEVKMQVEHFQNQFIIQKEQLDILSHDAKEHEEWLTNFAKENPVAIDHHLFADHEAMLEKISTFKQIYSGLKTEFNRFLATWM